MLTMSITTKDQSDPSNVQWTLFISRKTPKKTPFLFGVPQIGRDLLTQIDFDTFWGERKQNEKNTQIAYRRGGGNLVNTRMKGSFFSGKSTPEFMLWTLMLTCSCLVSYYCGAFLGPRGPHGIPPSVSPSARKIWITYIQAYMPHKSSEGAFL